MKRACIAEWRQWSEDWRAANVHYDWISWGAEKLHSRGQVCADEARYRQRQQLAVARVVCP